MPLLTPTLTNILLADGARAIRFEPTIDARRVEIVEAWKSPHLVPRLDLFKADGTCWRSLATTLPSIGLVDGQRIDLRFGSAPIHRSEPLLQLEQGLVRPILPLGPSNEGEREGDCPFGTRNAAADDATNA